MTENGTTTCTDCGCSVFGGERREQRAERREQRGERREQRAERREERGERRDGGG